MFFEINYGRFVEFLIETIVYRNTVKKEDQNYFGYSKPPVLDMKWANRDINVVEWANIPKFSALDDLVTPLRLLELFFVTYL